MDRPTTDPAEARAALATVAAMESAIHRRSQWPLWLAVVVAVSFGVNVSLRAYYGAGTALLWEGAVTVACVLPAFLLWVLHFRANGLVRRDAFRWASAPLIGGLYVLRAVNVEGYTGNLQAVLIHGALCALTILVAWGLMDGLVAVVRFSRRRR